MLMLRYNNQNLIKDKIRDVIDTRCLKDFETLYKDDVSFDKILVTCIEQTHENDRFCFLSEPDDTDKMIKFFCNYLHGDEDQEFTEQLKRNAAGYYKNDIEKLFNEILEENKEVDFEEDN
jgi:hypothetical protein